mmetsp:Transcript_26673/g.68489  ORF Transcript_26673/g.68489 Transcript_26673/m.68489 type:complete len:438 (-) Transcript_26673:1194-2507(-)
MPRRSVRGHGGKQFFSVLRVTVLSLPFVLIVYSVWSAWLNLRQSSCEGMAPPHRVLVVHSHVPQWTNVYMDNRLAQIATSLSGLGHDVALLVQESGDSTWDVTLEDPLVEKGVRILRSSEKNNWGRGGQNHPDVILAAWKQGYGLAVDQDSLERIRARFSNDGEEAAVALLMDTVDYISKRKIGGREEEVESVKAAQIKAVKYADYVLTGADDSSQILYNLVPGATVIPLSPFPFEFPLRPLERGKWVEGGKNLLYVGSLENEGNWRGMAWFLEEVWKPLLLSPQAQYVGDLHLVGTISKHKREIVESTYNRVRFHGFLHDLTPVIQESMLFVAPLKGVSGLAPSTLTALYNRIPLLTNSEGMWGLRLNDRDSICLVRDTAQEWLQAIGSVAEGTAGVDEKLQRADKHIDTFFSKQRFLRSLNSMILSVGDPACSPK